MIDNLVAYEFFKDADYYGVCETAANTAAKVVTIPDFTLENGVGVMVKFKNGNTTNSPTLNVSGTGAKPIYIDPSVGTSVSWEAWKVLPFVYDGTNWQLVCDPGIAVTQIPTDDSNNDYEVLFSKTPDNLEHMEEVRKSQYLNYNPNQRTLFVNDGNEHVDEVVTNSVLNRSYLTNNELGVIKTSNNVVTSLKVKDDDIVLYGTDNTWDGIHTSLKDIVKIGICLSQSLSGSTDISDTTPINLGGTMIQGNGRPILIQIYGVIKTDRNTSSLVMYIDGVEEVRAVTNSTTPMKVDGSAVVYLDAGIHTVSFKLVPQDNTTTATLCAYNTYGYTMIGA